MPAGAAPRIVELLSPTALKQPLSGTRLKSADCEPHARGDIVGRQLTSRRSGADGHFGRVWEADEIHLEMSDVQLREPWPVVVFGVPCELCQGSFEDLEISLGIPRSPHVN